MKLKTLALKLGEIREPAVTRYDIGREIFAHSHSDGTISKVHGWGKAELDRWLRELKSSGILVPHPNFASRVYQVLGRNEGNEEEIVCAIDRFGYLSHLSAMAFHGITNHLPARIVFSSPADAVWGDAAEARMRRDLGSGYEAYIDAALPRLNRIAISKINGKDVQRISSRHQGAYIRARQNNLRVSTLGRTFLEMLRSPELCGGIRHALEVFDEHAKDNLRLIVDEIEQHGSPIEKVRAGYILSERLDLKDDRVESWVQFAQRGGSRKLDPGGEYIPRWSEKWSLSLNVF